MKQLKAEEELTGLEKVLLVAIGIVSSYIFMCLI